MIVWLALIDVNVALMEENDPRRLLEIDFELTADIIGFVSIVNHLSQHQSSVLES